MAPRPAAPAPLSSSYNGGCLGERKLTDGKINPGENKVRVQTLDVARFVQRHHPELIPQISFVKIDIEGFDRHIIRSLSPLLGAIHHRSVLRRRPAILVECTRKRTTVLKRDTSTTYG